MPRWLYKAGMPETKANVKPKYRKNYKKIMAAYHANKNKKK